MHGKKVLVTGATGFIGSHLVQRLVQQGASVRAMSHYRSDPSLHNLAHLTADERAAVEVVRGNIEDPFFVRGAVAGCDAVFHLAALIAIPYSYVAPASYVATNITGTLNVLEACRSEGTPRVLHTSTSETYGSAQYTPIDEKHPLVGQSPYSASKIGADALAESYHRALGVPVVTIRPFNTFGPRQSARAVIPTIISQLAAGVPELKLGSLSPVRDFTYAGDTADGFIAGALADGVEGELFNLGVGSGITIGDLALRIMKLMDIEVPLTEDTQRVRPGKSEVMALISDNRKAKERLGWAPKVSLDEGLRRTIAFVRDHPELFRPAEYAV
jgi:NAD dependent epimerase/dehydratase